MNSDIIMNHNFHHVLKNIWKTFPEFSLVPNLVDRNRLLEKVNYDLFNFKQVHDGIAGVFITLSQRQAKFVSPLPTETLIWFGDSYIYGLLEGVGEMICIPDNLLGHHVGSETVKRLPGLQEILDEDKRQWENFVKPKMEEKIKQLKNK